MAQAATLYCLWRWAGDLSGKDPMTTTKAAVLYRETAHLPQIDRDLIARRLVVAIELVKHCPRATERPLTDKLQSFGDCPRWVCELVARAAVEVMTPARVAA